MTCAARRPGSTFSPAVRAAVPHRRRVRRRAVEPHHSRGYASGFGPSRLAATTGARLPSTSKPRGRFGSAYKASSSRSVTSSSTRHSCATSDERGTAGFHGRRRSRLTTHDTPRGSSVCTGRDKPIGAVALGPLPRPGPRGCVRPRDPGLSTQAPNCSRSPAAPAARRCSPWRPPAAGSLVSTYTTKASRPPTGLRRARTRRPGPLRVRRRP
jgi:hypothetical protein